MDGVVAAEQARRALEGSPRWSAARISDDDTVIAVDQQGRHDVSAESQRAGQLLEQLRVTAGALSEPMVEPDHDLPRLQRLHEDIADERLGLDRGDGLVKRPPPRCVSIPGLGDQLAIRN